MSVRKRDGRHTHREIEQKRRRRGGGGGGGGGDSFDSHFYDAVAGEGVMRWPWILRVWLVRREATGIIGVRGVWELNVSTGRTREYWESDRVR